MANLLLRIRRLLMWPWGFFSSRGGLGSTRSGGGMWSDPERSKALKLGLPSVLIAIIGIGMLSWAKYGLAGSLEKTYRDRAEKSATEKRRVHGDLTRELTTLRAAARANPNASSRSIAKGDLIPKDDERYIELEKWQNQEEAFLKKLRELNPEEPEYLYQLALSSWERGNVNQGMAQMALIAPTDEPGYVKAHLWLANQFYIAQSRAPTPAARQRFLALANRHADQSLKRERDNQAAKLVKAQVYGTVGNLEESYRYFKELNEEDVRYFRELVRINALLNRPELNTAILTDAISRYRALIQSDKTEDEERIVGWANMTWAYRMLKDFEEIEKLLIQEQQRYGESADDSTNRNRVERMLADVYLEWSSALTDGDSNQMTRRLELLEKAYRLDSSNQVVAQELTKLGGDADEEVAAQAKLIYDAEAQTDAPAMVYNVLGRQFLSHSDYRRAITNFEKARELNPRNSEVLNNLAYSYLCRNPPDANRALKLVDEALRFLTRSQNKKEYLSSIHDTRGRALMQLKKTAEAVAEFEIALKYRDERDSMKILKAIIECYDVMGIGSESYETRLKKLEELEAIEGDGQPADAVVH